jgi:threonine synthase
VSESKGAFICLSDDEILAAIPELARLTGIFAEPAGAAAFAGLVHTVSRHQISAEEKIVVLNTGNGLKDIAGAMQAVDHDGTKPYQIRPNFAELEKLVADWGITNGE